MHPIEVGYYDFQRIYLWLQYSDKLPLFTEIVIEVFYPNDMQAKGLVMFDHGFMIGPNLLFYPELVYSKITNKETPLFQVNPSRYYNYTKAAVDNKWAMAFVTTCHQQVEGMPWTDFGGSPRVGQSAYAAACYLIRYGATHKYDDTKAVNKARFLSSMGKSTNGNCMGNNVIFAGHSVGGAHAQAAACGFEALQEIGAQSLKFYDPIFYNGEVCPKHTPPLSKWDASQMATAAGLLQLSPVDGANGTLIPILAPGMKPYREYLSRVPMPNLMVTGSSDSACLDPNKSNPPAWIDVNDKKSSQYAQMAYTCKDSWAATCMVENGSHCSYLSEENGICSAAENNPTYRAGGAEYTFTNELFDQYIQLVSAAGPAGCSLTDWKAGSLMQWLNKEKPGTSGITLTKFPDGYVHFPG